MGQVENDVATGDFGTKYWDRIVQENHLCVPNSWRRYMQGVYRRLIVNWLPDADRGQRLKTDLFEEALSDESILPELGKNSLGLDSSQKVARAARRRLTKHNKGNAVLVCDLRNLSLRSSSVSAILSGSSLDHFLTKEELSASLQELNRILIPGGTLVLTLDNPSNPVVWLRNRLPFSWLNRLGLVPYYVGETCAVTEARERLEASGFTVTHCSAVAHAPRLLAIWAGRFAERFWNSNQLEWFERLLERAETLEAWPTRYQTGYYIAMRAVRCRS